MQNPFQHPTGQGSFLPQEYVAGRSEQRANLICLALFSVVMLGVIGAFVVTNSAWKYVRERQLAIDTQYVSEAEKIDQLKQLEAQRTIMLDKAEVTAALIENVPRSVLLGELVLRLPPSVKLTEMSLKGKRVDQAPQPAATSQVRSLADKNAPAKEPERPKIVAPRFEHSLMLRGVSDTNNGVADYLKALKDCTLLDRVELQYIRESKINDREFRQFEIQAILRPEADGRSLAKDLQQRFQEMAQSGAKGMRNNVSLTTTSERTDDPGRKE